MLGNTSLASLATLRNFRRERLSSYDRSGGNLDAIVVAPGDTAVLGEIKGAGCVKHTWFTMMSWPERDYEWTTRDVTYRCFWDGEESPSVSVPIGDFHGVGFGMRRNMASLPVQMSPQDGRSFNSWFPMPFANGARFEITNESEHQLIFYFYIDYEAYDRLDESLGRFHAHYRQHHFTEGVAAKEGWTRADYGYNEENTAGPGMALQGPWLHPNLTGDDNYVIADICGNGQYVGCVLNINVLDRQVNDWYGEGDDMIFIDNEPWPPRLHGTGTEDYFNTAFCPRQEFSDPYAGITVYSGTDEWPWGGRNSMYRFHVEDPIRFNTACKVTIEVGHANALANRYSSVAYWYQLDRAEELPALPSATERHEP